VSKIQKVWFFFF
jgi:WD40 repeat protein